MMRNHQVYLSKSNRANPDHVMLVRRHLESLGYVVVEHQGGDYDESLIFKCRYMVMVGIHAPSHMNEGCVEIGKGQYQQLLHRKNRSTNYYHAYFSHTDDNDDPVYRSVAPIKVVDDTNWTTRYGLLQVKMNTIRKLPMCQPRQASDSKNHYPIGTISGESLETVRERKKVHLACITLFN